MNIQMLNQLYDCILYQFHPLFVLGPKTQLTPQRGLLGPRPTNQHQANIAQTDYQPTTDFSKAFNTMTLADPGAADWYMDTGATSHFASSAGILNSCLPSNIDRSVTVGNGSKIPIVAYGSSCISSSSCPLALNKILVAPAIVKNLIFVRKFTKDNWCYVDFDPFGLSVKDCLTGITLLRCNSSSDLYTVPGLLKSPPSQSAFLTISSNTWHKRLAHTNKDSLRSVIASNQLSCNKKPLSFSCLPYQLGKQIKLPFVTSNSQVSKPAELIHSDVWTFLSASMSGIKYYVLFLDDFSHFVWVYPLR